MTSNSMSGQPSTIRHHMTIAGHTHRVVVENLFLTERRYPGSKILDICFGKSQGLSLVEWIYATEGNILTIQRMALFPDAM